jgi:hypothetical protein
MAKQLLHEIVLPLLKVSYKDALLFEQDPSEFVNKYVCCPKWSEYTEPHELMCEFLDDLFRKISSQ